MALQPLDAQFECRAILERMVYRGTEPANGPMPEAAAYYIRSFHLTKEEAVEFEPLIEVYNQVAQNLCVPQEELERWFLPLSAENNPAGALLYVEQLLSHAAKGPLPLQGGAREDGTDKIYAYLLQYMQPLFDASEEAQIVDQAQFLQQVSALSLEGPNKWRLVELGLHFYEYLATVKELLARAEVLFALKAALLQPVTARFTAVLQKRIQEQGLTKMLEKVGIVCDELPDLAVYPSAMRFSGIGMMLIEGDAENWPVATLHYGIFFDSFSEKAEKNGNDFLQKRLKALDDKNRLAILCALRETPLGGQDIIALTGLSAATVSHHMSELIGAELVSVEKQGITVVYRLRRSGVQGLLEELTQKLL